MMNRILVTGGTGFLGRNLVRTLIEYGYRVRLFVRPGILRHPLYRHESLEEQGAEIVFGDILDGLSIRKGLEGIDTVFHLAGRLHIPGIPHSEYMQVHVDGTRNLLEACREQSSIRSVVHCSSTGVLGPTGLFPLTEEAHLNPSNIYEASKAAGEKLALEMAFRYAIPVTVARPSLAYGPGDLHLLAWYRSIQNGLYRLIGRGENLLHPVFVDDVVEGLIRCATCSQASGRVYHLVGQQPISIRELAKEIASALSRRILQPALPIPVAFGLAAVLENMPGIPPHRLPLTRSRVRFLIESRVYSGQRAQQELGFFPQVDLESGLRKTVAWYRQERLL